VVLWLRQSVVFFSRRETKVESSQKAIEAILLAQSERYEVLYKSLERIATALEVIAKRQEDKNYPWPH
jgi:hypothetical protein